MSRAVAAMIIAALLSAFAPAAADTTDQRARNVAREYGYRPFCPFGQLPCRTFVPADLPRITMERDQLASISVSAMFHFDRSVHAPPLKGGSEYVEILWVQRGPESMKALIADTATGAAFTAYSCKFDGHFHFCDFTVPRAALTHPTLVKFMSPHQAPGVLPGRSIAWLAYETLSEHVRSLARDGVRVDPNDRDDDTYRNLARLHALDPEIPATP